MVILAPEQQGWGSRNVRGGGRRERDSIVGSQKEERIFFFVWNLIQILLQLLRSQVCNIAASKSLKEWRVKLRRLNIGEESQHCKIQWVNEKCDKNIIKL